MEDEKESRWGGFGERTNRSTASNKWQDDDAVNDDTAHCAIAALSSPPGRFFCSLRAAHPAEPEENDRDRTLGNVRLPKASLATTARRPPDHGQPH